MGQALSNQNCFSNSKHLLARLQEWAFYDCASGKLLANIISRPRSRFKSCFFDIRGLPKAIIESNELAVMDVATAKTDFAIKEPALFARGLDAPTASKGSGRHVSSASYLLATAQSEEGLLFLNSLENGCNLQVFVIPSAGHHNPYIGPTAKV